MALDGGTYFPEIEVEERDTLEDFGFELDSLASYDDLNDLYEHLTDQEKAELDAILRTAAPRDLMPHQIVPIEETWWEIFLLIGGRGTGKTVTGAFATIDHLRTHGEHARIGIGAPTSSDARDTCMEGETGLIKMFRSQFTSYNRSLGEARHINGGVVKAMGTENPDRWNGPQWSMVWFDELALCNQKAWDDANMGLRMGERPYAVCTTTPKARKWVKELALDKTTYVPQYIDTDEKGNLYQRVPTTFDNTYLPERRIAWLRNKYEGSRLGLQELHGSFIDDIAGAMWNRKIIHHRTDPKEWPRAFQRIVVAIDPAGSRARQTADKLGLTEDDRQNQRKNADTGLAVVGLGVDGLIYVLELKSGQYSPSAWAMEAIRLYHKFRADRIVAEKNFGGEMVENTLRTINEFDRKTGIFLIGKNLPITLVHASRGKDIRAEPVAALYEQGRVFHCKYFALGEDQMCSFIDADDNVGADMVDALVWGITNLAGLEDIGNIILAPPDPRLSAYVFHMK